MTMCDCLPPRGRANLYATVVKRFYVSASIGDASKGVSGEERVSYSAVIVIVILK